MSDFYFELQELIMRRIDRCHLQGDFEINSKMRITNKIIIETFVHEALYNTIIAVDIERLLILKD
jgi:hypothetical protein